jgi:hypothetical protein
MALYGVEEVNSGPVIITPCVTPARQRELFQAELSHIDARDLTNTVIEVDRTGVIATCWEYPYPPSS